MRTLTSTKGTPLLSSPCHLLAVPVRVLPLLSPLLSSHQVLNTLSSALFKKMMKENTARCDDQSWTSIVAPFECFFHNKVMLPLKIMYVYDEILVSNLWGDRIMEVHLYFFHTCKPIQSHILTIIDPHDNCH